MLTHTFPNGASIVRRGRLLAGSAIILTLLAAGPALAETPAAPASAQGGPASPADAPPARDAATAPQGAATDPADLNEQQVQDIIVTGSSIRGVAPTGSQLIGVSQAQIADTAPANTKELLAAIPALGNFGANAEQSTSNRFRTAGYQPNIHNVGIYATLTLFNGHRFAPVGGEAVFPDPSIIPVIAVQRVEVVADGGSAIYGSDAVAGVVNFIYRRNVEGIEGSVTYGFNDTRYRKYDAALIAGHSWGTGNVMLAYEYSQNRSPLTTDIDFLALGGDQTSRGGRDLRSSNCLQPNVTVNNRTYAYPGYTVGRNTCGLLDAGSIIPDGHRHAALLTARQELGDNVELWTEINYSNYKTRSFGGQTSLALIIPNTNPYFQLPPGEVADSILIRRSALGLFPSRFSIQSSKAWGVTAGADVDLGGDWRGTAMVHVSKTNDFNSDPELDLVNAEAAANGTTLATALNPFGQAADNNPAVLASIDDNYRRDNRTSQRLRELQFKADGPLFDIGGGTVRAAVGVDFREEEAVQLQTSGTALRRIITVRDDDIDRTVMAGYGELNIPLVGTTNEMPWLHQVTLSLAGRVDYYRQYGAQFNPKYGIVIAPFAGYSLHASYGTSFVAPNLGLLSSKFGYVGSRDQTTPYTDWETGQPLQIPYNIYNSGGGNPDLQPESAKTYSFGVDLAPPQIRGLRFSASYYHVTYENTIYKATLTDAITNPAFAAYRVINPTPAQIAAEMAAVPPEMEVQSYITWDVIFRSYAINLGVRKFAGIDFDGGYDFSTGIGDFNFAWNANLKLTDKQQVLPSAPFNDRLGTDQAPRWKGRLALTWALDPVTINLAANYVDSFRYNNGSMFKKADSWTTFDLVGRLSLDNLHKGLSLQGRVVNLFDKDPPFVDNANGYLPALASPFGRQFELTLRAKM
ncbi:TonB-dependent receptor domain-containing protein [Sphingobium aquiterrae]|uniref:TonB-dependent receptor domain-containing protein n=1 Tax=Sphingobium aquiterrae TaxID=2038656 RepID=UPI0030164F92